MTDTEIIDVEPGEVFEVPPDATLVRAPVGQVSIYQSTDPAQQLAEARERAQILLAVVEEQGLARSFGGGRPHVQVEGWQFLASQFGLVPDIEWTRELSDGWEARAALTRLSDGVVVAHGDAECRRTESNWRNRDSYALRSMAQTRAVSKVCRIALSSVMVMAGFSATPAEEMDGIRKETPAPTTSAEPHCPACLYVNGELVALTLHDAKPYQRCTNPPEKCAGNRTWNDKLYSWAGWREDWKDSVQEWKDNNPDKLGPTEKTVGGRGDYWGWVLEEIRSTAGVDKAEAKAMAKTALYASLDEIDVNAALNLPETTILENELREIEMVQIAKNLTATEAQIVVTAAVQYGTDQAPF